MCQRTTSPILSEPLPMQDCSCPNYLLYKVVGLSLRRQRGIQLLNGTKKSVTEEGFGPIDPVIRNQPALSTELLSLIGAKKAKRIDIAPK